VSREKFGKIYTLIDRVRLIAILGIFGFIVSVGAVQIFMRYTPGINAMSWVDEIMRYLNIWLVLLAASIGVKHGTHLKMDYLLYKYVPKKNIRVIKLVTEILIISALLILIYFGVLRVLDNLRTEIQSMPLSIAFFYAAIPVGGGLILFEYVLIFIFKEHPYTPNGACKDLADI
jgi:TRAP-type C4-dicarboxylate transport system permease small subunit